MFLVKNETELDKVLRKVGRTTRPFAVAICDNCGERNYVRLDHAKRKIQNNAKSGKELFEYVCLKCAFGTRKYVNIPVVE